MKKKIFLAVFLCCGMFAAMAQTAADSLAIVSADPCHTGTHPAAPACRCGGGHQWLLF